VGKKKRFKGIKEAVTELPVLMVNTHEKHYRSGEELNADNRETATGTKFDPGKQYVDAFPVQIAINHTRRLKKLVNQFGPEIIPVYKQAVEESKHKFE
jgi:hypothetical protein